MPRPTPRGPCLARAAPTEVWRPSCPCTAYAIRRVHRAREDRSTVVGFGHRRGGVRVHDADQALGDGVGRLDAGRAELQVGQHDDGEVPLRVVSHEGLEARERSGVTEHRSEGGDGEAVARARRDRGIDRLHAVKPLPLNGTVEQPPIGQRLGVHAQVPRRGAGGAGGPRPRWIQIRVVVGRERPGIGGSLLVGG